MDQPKTFLQIRMVHHLSLEAIAAVAHVAVEDIYYLEAGVSYPQTFIDTVLKAVSKLTGEAYSRANVGGIYSIEKGGKQ